MKDSQTLLPPDDEARYRLLTEGTNDIIYSVDRDGKLLYISPQIEQYGFVAEDLISTNFLEHVAVEDRDWVADDFLQTYRVQAKSGEYRWIDDWNHTIRNEDGEITHIQGIILDVTSRKEAELALNRSRLMLQQAQRMANIGSWLLYLPEKRIVWSDQLFRLHGVDKDSFELTLVNIRELFHPKDRDLVREAFQESVKTDTLFEAEFRIVKKDSGEVREVLSRGQHIAGGPEDDDRWVGTTLDVTELRRLERRILDVARDEQQRLGQDLHDTLGQELAGLAFLAKAMERKLAHEGSSATADARQLSSLATESVSHAKRIAHGLAPVDVAAGALAHELDTLATGTRDLYDVVCQCTVTEPALVHDNSAATHLYHIAREAVSNAARHSNAGYIGIDLATHGDEGTFTITDDGTWKKEDIGPIGHGMGLKIMKSRAAIIDATVSINHGIGIGTTVKCVFNNVAPLESEGNSAT